MLWIDFYKNLKEFLSRYKYNLLAVVVVCALAYGNIFDNRLVGDDKDFLISWEAMRNGDVIALVLGDLPSTHTGTYRPVRSLAYVAVSSVAGVNPVIYHWFGLMVQLSISLGLFLVVVVLGGSASLATVSALLFAAHPIHTEAITFITASFDTISFLFLILSFLSFVWWYREKGKFKYRLALGLSGLAIYTNEASLVLPGLLVGYVFFFGKFDRDVFKKIVPFVSIGLLYFVIRSGLHLESRGEWLVSPVLHWLVSLKAVFKYLELMVWPVGLNLVHELPGGISTYVFSELNHSAVSAQSVFELHVLLAVVILIGLVGWMVKVRKSNPLIGFAIAWTLTSLLPVSNVVPSSLIFTERYAYLASIGFCIILANLLLSLAKICSENLPFKVETRWLRIFFVGVTTLLLILITRARNADWKNEISLWESAVEVAPENPVVNLQMAKAYLVGEETEKAKLKYQKALDLAPTFVEALVGLGNIYQFEGSFELAIDHYERALTLNPDLEGVRQNLWESYLRDVQAYKEVGDFTTAFEKLDRARVYNRREADEQIVILCSEAPSYCL